MAYAYVHVPDAVRSGKLSAKAEKLRFIGYSSQAKAYHLINEKTLKVIVRQDVIFNVSDFVQDSVRAEVDDTI